MKRVQLFEYLVDTLPYIKKNQKCTVFRTECMVGRLPNIDPHSLELSKSFLEKNEYWKNEGINAIPQSDMNLLLVF